MYSLTVTNPAVATTVAAHQTRESVETSRLARAAKLAREGRGEPDDVVRHHFQPRHRSRIGWLLGLRANTAL
jgi:hypothetical protein